MPFHPIPTNLALPPTSLILITGATGFLATHIVTESLAAGYHVRGTARTEAKARADEAYHANPRYTCVVVPDATEKFAAALTKAGKGEVVWVKYDGWYHKCESAVFISFGSRWVF